MKRCRNFRNASRNILEQNDRREQFAQKKKMQQVQDHKDFLNYLHNQINADGVVIIPAGVRLENKLRRKLQKTHTRRLSAEQRAMVNVQIGKIFVPLVWMEKGLVEPMQKNVVVKQGDTLSLRSNKPVYTRTKKPTMLERLLSGTVHPADQGNARNMPYPLRHEWMPRFG